MLGPEVQRSTKSPTRISVDGQDMISFSGCDYYGLSCHPVVTRASKAAAEGFGWNVSASRITTGNHPLYTSCENALRDFFGAHPLVTSSGYVSNLIAAQSVRDLVDQVLIDEGAHPSLWDAAYSTGLVINTYTHKSAASLLEKLEASAESLVMTDGVFPVDGSTPPLREYAAILAECPGSYMLVDDAHGAGVLGEDLTGAVGVAAIRSANVIQTITLSKAFGCYGGAILGDKTILQRASASRAFAGSTPAPLPSIAGACAALGLLRRDPTFALRLRKNVTTARSILSQTLKLRPDSGMPIIACDVEARRAESLMRALKETLIHPPFVKYPGMPAEGIFRFVITSEHNAEDFNALECALKQFATS